MPNLVPPVRTCDDAEAYYTRIRSSLDKSVDFQPLMTIYLTDHTTVRDIELAANHPDIFGAKLYPAGATTNSDAGVTDLNNIHPVLDAMQKYGLVLQVHGEVTAPDVDIFDREKKFIDEKLKTLRETFPDLKIVFEHITTCEAVEYVKEAGNNTAATITPHHLLINRNSLFTGGIRPHHYCLPVVKREKHRQALLDIAVTNNSRFFAGTDSAPHSKSAKESACGCAGIYSAYCAVELYAEAFEMAENFKNFEAFMSLNGPKFYGLPINSGEIHLIKESWTVPDSLDFGSDRIIPFKAGEQLQWKVTTNE